MRIVAATITLAAFFLAMAFIVSYSDVIVGFLLYLTDTVRSTAASLGAKPDEVWPPVAAQIDAYIAGAGLLIAALLVIAVAVTYAHTRRR